jgi:excinuclease ABC subunit C
MGRRVHVLVPQRGPRAKLMDLAEKNAEASAASRQTGGGDALAALEKLQARLGLARLPRRIECYDIAHLQGVATVASMVVFVDGQPASAEYRTFKVKSAANDDFASMYEVLARRLRRAKAALDGTEADPDTARWAEPDLLVVDGGKGQLSAALAALNDLAVPLGGDTGLEVIGLAKERELDSGDAPDRIYRRGVKDAIALRANSPELYVLARIRDEAHRFANTFHRDRRSKSTLRSELDAIPGIGATRRQRLLKHFGSVRAVRQATVDELVKAPGMNRKAALQVADYFAQRAKLEAETGADDDAVLDGDELDDDAQLLDAPLDGDLGR